MTPDPLLQAFDRLAAGRPTAALLVSPSHRVTVAGVDALARAAGGRLAVPGTAGPAPGEAVGLQAANGPAFLAALLALRRAGLAPLLLDRRTPALERQRLAAEVGARFVLVATCPWATGPDDFHLDPVAPPSTPPREVGGGTAVIKLSSGSTGSARGIAASAASLIADDAALTATMGLSREDRFLATIPFSHSYGLSSLVVPALLRGNLLVLPDHDGPFGPLVAAGDAGATVFPTVPAYLAALNRLGDPPPLAPSLRKVLTAGALLTGETSAGFRSRFGLTPHVFYGASESGGICFDREGGAAERGTVGSPVEGVTVDLAPVDPEATGDGGDLPGAGRVVVRSPAVASGYLPPEPERLDGERYATDDLATWRGGELVLEGRLNDLINVRGKKVNPREVERVLRDLPGVDEAAVVAAGTGRGVVRAVVACRTGSLDAEGVVTWCRHRLADHKVPRSVVLLEALPRTERGKVDRAALGELAERHGGSVGPAAGNRAVDDRKSEGPAGEGRDGDGRGDRATAGGGAWSPPGGRGDRGG